MNALQGLSALAAEMPRLQTHDEDQKRGMRMLEVEVKSSVNAAAAKPQVNEVSVSLFPKTLRCASSSLPLRKRPCDVELTAAPAATAATRDDALASHLRDELARRLATSLGVGAGATFASSLYDSSSAVASNYPTASALAALAFAAPHQEVLAHGSHGHGQLGSSFFPESSGYPPLPHEDPTLNPMLGASAALAQARAAEAQARTNWLNAKAAQEQMIYQDALYQEKLLLGHQRQQTTGLHGMLLNGLAVEDVMSVLKYYKAQQAHLEISSNAGNNVDTAAPSQHPQPHRLKPFYLPTDSNFLSEAHCFLRSMCIELFVSTDEHVRAGGKGARPARRGQAGFRCVHCKNIPRCQQANQAICYPSKRENIYKCVRNFQRVHFHACMYTPEGIKQQYKNIAERGLGPRRSQKLVRAYYAQAAAEANLVNTPHGGLEYRVNALKCTGPSSEMVMILQAAEDEKSFVTSTHVKLCSDIPACSSKSSSSVDENVKYGKFESVISDETRQVMHAAREESTPFLLPQDFSTISDYVYLLFHQLLPCKPNSATIKRRRLKADQLQRIPGLCCKHCHNMNDGISGTYFPQSDDSLGDSSFSQTLMLHISTCSHVPPRIKMALDELKALAKEYRSCVKRGAKKTFMEKVWGRMEDYSRRNSQGSCGGVEEASYLGNDLEDGQE